MVRATFENFAKIGQVAGASPISGVASAVDL